MAELLEDTHDANAYFAAFDDIINALDDLSKVLTPDESDDNEPSDGETRPCCNSYFASFQNIRDALGRVKEATVERLAAHAETDPTFSEWRSGSYNINIGQSAKVVSNGIAIDWGSGAGAATSPNSKAKDSGAVALGKQAHAYGYEAVALGKNANVGADGNRVSDSTVQLGAGTNLNNGSLQFRSWPLVDDTGKIYADRLPDTGGGLAFVTPEVTGGVATLADKAVNSVALGGAETTLAFPDATEGQGRAFIVRFDCTAETAWHLPSGVSFMSDDAEVFSDIVPGQTVAYVFSEIADGTFMVSKKILQTVTKS